MKNEMLALINILKSAEMLNISGRGIVYVGITPFAVDKSNPEEWAALTKRPWIIDHPSTEGKLWKIKGLESYATPWITSRQSIGLMVEPWEEELTNSIQ